MRKSFFHFFLAGMAIAAVGCVGVEGDDEHAFVKEANGLVEVEPEAIGEMPTSAKSVVVSEDGESLTIRSREQMQTEALSSGEQNGTICEGYCTPTFCSCKGPTWCCSQACAICVNQ